LEELKKLLPETEFLYGEYYQKAAYSKEMLWPKLGEFMDFARQADAVLLFVGAQESEDTEKFDRRTLRMNPNYDMYVEAAIRTGKPTIVVCQSGSAVVFDEDTRNAHAIVQMWLAGEAAGGAIADVLTGKVNPSGKLSETFPKEPRTDLQYPGNGHYIEYTERFRVGYRYYDLHPEEILFPFGHGLSYTSFWYSNLSVEKKEDGWQVSFDVTNNGSLYGAEVAQLYICDPVSTVPKPVKELKKFKKLRLAPGETQSVSFTLTERDLSYYNVSLHRWVAEDGKYHILVGSSSQDIRLQGTILHTNGKDYTIRRVGVDMIG
jgi:beta-glucosidase